MAAQRLLVLTTTFLPEHNEGENPCRAAGGNMVVSGCRARMTIGAACNHAHERGRGERIGSMEQQRAEALRKRL